MGEVSTPPRSVDYIVSSIVSFSIGAVDLFLIFRFETIFGSLATELSLVVLVAMAISLLPAVAQIRIKYVLTGKSLIVQHLLGKDEIMLKDIARIDPHRLSYSRHILWNFNPAHTTQNGLMIEALTGRKLFISPKDPEKFAAKIRQGRNSD